MSDAATITEQVRKYAAAAGQLPFISRQCFDDLEDVEEIQPVYVALNNLFKQGQLARRKNGVGFEYLLPEYADSSYERANGEAKTDPNPVIPKNQCSTQSILGSAEQYSKTANQKALKPKPAIPETAIRKAVEECASGFIENTIGSTDAMRITINIEKMQIVVEGL